MVILQSCCSEVHLIKWVGAQSSALQCSAVHWTIVQCNAVCCSAVQCSIIQVSADFAAKPLFLLNIWIILVSALLSAHNEGFSVSRMRDFLWQIGYIIYPAKWNTLDCSLKYPTKLKLVLELFVFLATEAFIEVKSFYRIFILKHDNSNLLFQLEVW